MHFNIINPEAIDLYLERRCPRLTALLRQCLGRALRRERKGLNRLNAFPDNSPVWLTPERFAEGDGYYWFDGHDEDVQQKVQAVEGWLQEALSQAAPWLSDLDEGGRVRRLCNRGTFAQVLALVRKDGERAGQQSQRSCAGGKGTEVALELPDGKIWVRLLSAAAVRSEGLRLRHCLNKMTAQAWDKGGVRCGYYSLRDATQNLSFVTARVWQCYVAEVRGVKNAEPDGYWEAVAALQELIGAQWRQAQYELWRQGKDVHHFTPAPPSHPAEESQLALVLPDGLTWRRIVARGQEVSRALGHFTSSSHQIGRMHLFKLVEPAEQRGLVLAGAIEGRIREVRTYYGSSPCLRWGAVDALERHLDTTWVAERGFARHTLCRDWRQLWDDRCEQHSGDIKLWHQNELLRMPHTMHITGTLNLARHQGLEALPDLLRVGCNLNVQDCANLRVMPRWLRVGGSMDLSNCPMVRRLPRDTTVGGHLSLMGCSSLERLPSGLRVGGRLYLAGSGIQHIPQSVSVGAGICFQQTTYPTGTVYWTAKDANRYLRSLRRSTEQQILTPPPTPGFVWEVLR